MTDRREAVRRAWTLLEPVHAVTYFSAEPLAELRAAGYRGFWMGYFAGRAAPLGPVGPDVVRALFYNFSPERVERALPSAWELAEPGAALAARLTGSVAALRRQLGPLADAEDLLRASALVWRAAASAPVEGRALFAANRALDPPEEPLALLWHAATLLREHRGDGHVATLMALGIGGRDSHVFHALANGTPRQVYELARDFDDEEWSRRVGHLQRRGLCTPTGLTDEGRRLRSEIEARTDALAATAYEELDDAELTELLELLRPLAAAVVAGGDLPLDSPMGLDLRDLLDR